MADFRSVVSYGLFGSATKKSNMTEKMYHHHLYVFFQISTRTTQEWNL